MSTSNHPTIRQHFVVNVYDERTGTVTRTTVRALSVHGALQEALNGSDRWTEAEVSLPDGTQCAVYDNNREEAR